MYSNTLFVGSTTKMASKEKQQLTSMKSDVELFSRLYISCQTRDGNLKDFFQHENQAWQPVLSDWGRLWFGTKSELLTCLEDLSPSQTKAPDATFVVLDGAAIIQMLTTSYRTTQTFKENAHKVFIPFVSEQLWNVSHLDFVWDSHIAASPERHSESKVRKGSAKVCCNL